MASINTAGDLRQFLCNSIDSVAIGTLDIAKAREISKLAGQVNESIYAEVKVARMQIDLGKEAGKSFVLGELKMG